MFPDADILERRLRQLERLPWPIPATVIIRMSEEDLDNLDAAADTDRYWSTLNRIVTRIEEEAAWRKTPTERKRNEEEGFRSPAYESP